MTRIREQIATRAKGTAWKNGVYSGTGQVVPHYRSFCEDDLSEGDNHYFAVNKYDFEGGHYNKPDPGTTFGYWFDDWVVDCLATEGNFPFMTLSGDKGNSGYATEATARTNPSRPYVDVPVAMLELTEIPALIKKSGDSILKQLAGGNIKYQFGIAPLADDLAKLTNLFDQVNRRVGELKRLRSRKGLRRTVTHRVESESGVKAMTINSYGNFVSDKVDYTSSYTVKTHCRWMPADEDFMVMDSGEMSALARKALLGLTVDFATVWERIPWSWLIDYGTTIGSFFKAKRNIVPAQLVSCMVMRHRTTKWTYNGKTIGPQEIIDPFQVRRDAKLRVPGIVTPTAHFPLLSGKQMGILTSLAILRR